MAVANAKSLSVNSLNWNVIKSYSHFCRRHAEEIGSQNSAAIHCRVTSPSSRKNSGLVHRLHSFCTTASPCTLSCTYEGMRFHYFFAFDKT